MVFFFRTPLLYHACGFACVVTFSVLARMTVFASLTHPHCAFKHREGTRGDTYDWSDMLLRITNRPGYPSFHTGQVYLDLQTNRVEQLSVLI